MRLCVAGGVVLAALAAGCAARAAGPAEAFGEELVVRRLGDGKVLQHFEFAVEREATAEDQHNYRLFPRQIGEIAQRHAVRSLQLAFTQGNWREQWGYAPAPVHGAGAELLARIAAPAENATQQWRGLANALSGVFCASLNFIDETNTDSPGMGAGPAGLRRGRLPRENVCTENLTPWIKQLPCQAKSGLGALLNPHRLFNAHFYSMGVSLETAPASGGGRPALRYTQHLTVVLDPRAFGLADDGGGGGGGWTLGALMDRPLLAAACPVASRSTVRVTGFRATPRPDSAAAISDDAAAVTHTFDLLRRRIDDIGLSAEPARNESLAGPVVSVHRYVTGSGGIDGGVEAILTNRHAAPVRVTYLDSLPWYLRVYSHTLQVRTAAGKALRPARVAFSPAVDRGRPSSLAVELELPPASRTVVRFAFEKGFLKYTEHPPDANRGFNVAPAVVSYTLPGAEPACPRPTFPCRTTSSR
ncbi:Subunit of the glycosylphosphatidylinositol transamidase complex-like protein [Coemansia javaensis]|uniref:Subunit of the glycosylphosphatidylinositol transamidase complex-like protein n=1 Tax=Coemansia javaensis TaxID=2761396 RepID=A0A9W8H834_9FUNG|nr:Subunit of the glycosylphosphatidylinositol transamidase complex-like protein [Coemansia javaensis]